MNTCLPTTLWLEKIVKEAGSGLLILEVKMCISASLWSPNCENVENPRQYFLTNNPWRLQAYV